MNKELLNQLQQDLFAVHNQLNNRKFLVKSKDGEYVEIKQYSNADLGVDGNFYVHKPLKGDGYVVSEASTGLKIADGINEGIAIGKARSAVNSFVEKNGIEAFKAMLAKHVHTPIVEPVKEVEPEPIAEPIIVPIEEKPNTIETALGKSLDYHNRIDIPYISEQLMMEEMEVEEMLLSKGLAFINPESEEMETVEEYLSGNVREKLVVAEFASKQSPKYERNYEELKKIIPETIPSALIQYSLGAAWIPLKIFEKFATDMFKTKITVVYMKSTGKFSATNRSMRTIQMTSTYSAGGKNGLEIFNATLNNQQIVVTDIIDKKSVKNIEKTTSAQAMQEQMQDEFVAFIRANPDIETETEEIYNNLMNSHVAKPTLVPTIDHYPNASQHIMLMAHQKVGVAGSLNESGLIADEVGLGKSIIAITTAMEMRRLGLANKVMIVVQNKTRGQFISKFRELYPNATILAPTKEELSVVGKADLYERIANEDFDAVIMPQSQFDAIPDDIKRQRDMLEHLLSDSEDMLYRIDKRSAPFEYAQAKRASRSISKELQDLNNEEEKREETYRVLRENGGTQQRLLNFEEMNVDALLVDECFPYETPILTIHGMMPIGFIVENKIETEVLSYNEKTQLYEPKKITRWLPKKLKNKLVKITHTNGSFVCTENHKILTDIGYIEAGLLTNERTITYVNLPNVQSDSTRKESEILLPQMLCGNDEEKSKTIPDLLSLQKEQGKKERKQVLLTNLFCGIKIQRNKRKEAYSTNVQKLRDKTSAFTCFKILQCSMRNSIKDSNKIMRRMQCYRDKNNLQKQTQKVLFCGVPKGREKEKSKHNKILRFGKGQKTSAYMSMVQRKTCKTQKEKILLKVLFSILSKSVARDSKKKQRAWDKGIVSLLFGKEIPRKTVSSPERPCGKSKENERENERKNISVPRWKRSVDKTSDCTTGSIGSTEMLDGMGYKNKTYMGSVQIPTEPLQGRHWYSTSENLYRGGWFISSDEEMEVLGQKENRNFECVRVESCEMYEQRDRRGLGVCSEKNDRVYDIEVEDNHNYFAAGVLVSNCHRYKRLGVLTSMTGIKGIDTAKSRRAQSFLIKLRWVQQNNKGRNTIGYTGTPISNTMAEAWTMIRFFRPDILVELGIEHFDQFAKTFGQVVPSLEMTGGGTFKISNRFAKFQNLPEFVGAFKRCVRVMFKEDVPEFVKNNTLPRMFDDKIQQVVIKQSEELRLQIKEFRETLEWYDGLEGAEKREKRWIPLVIFNRAKQSAIDLRLLNPTKMDSPQSKVNQVIRKAYAIYRETGKVQMIFCDLYQSPEPKSPWLDDDETIPNPAFGKPRFNLFNDIRNKLVSMGVKPNEIAILTEPKYDKVEKAEQLFDDANRGRVKFLLGSTEKMGVGVNAQKKLIALHHIDAPLRPMDFSQRNGRIIRQGNENKQVWIFTYGVEKTLDSAAFQRLAIKQKFINQIMKGENLERIMDDAADDALVTFEEMMAILSDSPFAQQKLLLDNKLKTERLKRDNHHAKQVQTQRQLNNAYEAIRSLELKLESEREHFTTASNFFPDGALNKLEIKGLLHNEHLATVLDEYIEELMAVWNDSPAQTAIGRIKANGADVTLKIVNTERWSKHTKGMYDHPTLTYVIPQIGINENYYGNGVTVDSNSGSGMLMSMRWKVEGTLEAPVRTQREMDTIATAITELEKNMDNVFDETKLFELEAEIEVLKQKMLEERLKPEIEQEILEVN